MSPWQVPEPSQQPAGQAELAGQRGQIPQGRSAHPHDTAPLRPRPSDTCVDEPPPLPAGAFSHPYLFCLRVFFFSN